MSVLPPKAEINSGLCDVSFVAKADIDQAGALEPTRVQFGAASMRRYDPSPA